jgi:hypothetical protein
MLGFQIGFLDVGRTINKYESRRMGGGEMKRWRVGSWEFGKERRLHSSSASIVLNSQDSCSQLIALIQDLLIPILFLFSSIEV